VLNHLKTPQSIPEQVIAKIGLDGSVILDFEGYHGEGCLLASEKIIAGLKELGVECTTSDFKRKPAMEEETESVQQTHRQSQSQKG
jgi:hypothetical protein